MSTNHTINYALNQWEGTDKVLRTEFNADNAKIDAALKANADAIAAEAAAREAAGDAMASALAAKGNCAIYTASYTGNGQCGADHPNSLTFPARPKLAVLYNKNIIAFLLPETGNMIVVYAGGVATGTILDTGDPGTLSWYSGHPDYQMNFSGKSYYAVALVSAD